MAGKHHARAHAPDPQALYSGLAEAGSKRHVLQYMTNMWTQVLESAVDDSSDRPWEDRWGELQLPYVPVEPERCGVALTADSTVLDVGCLSGYGLYDLYRRRAAQGLPIPRMTGVDNDPTACQAGRNLARHWGGDAIDVRFVTADCQALPFPAQSFDLVISRLVLPYVELESGLRELRRVLRPSGLAIVQVIGPRYYLAQLAESVRSPGRLAYYARPLASGAFFACTGRAPRSARFRETALTTSALTRYCRRLGLSPVWTRPTRYRPVVIMRAH
jgi:SAM-dependent methyltransferase